MTARPTRAGRVDVSGKTLTVYDEDGDAVAEVPAGLALRALTGLEEHRRELEREIARQQWAESLAHIANLVMRTGVGAPNVELTVDYDGEVAGTVRFRSVDDLLVLGEDLGVIVGVRSRFDYNVEDQYRSMVTYFAVDGLIEYIVYENEVDVGEWVAPVTPEPVTA